MKAKYKCRKCEFTWEQNPEPTTCPDCGYHYVDWLNYDEWQREHAEAEKRAFIPNKILVVLPTFNSMRFVRHAAESILAQDYPNMEVWACDNESTDGTYEYLTQLAEGDERMSVHSLPNLHKNGYPEAWHYCFRGTDAEYITFIASDDYVAPDYISKCMAVFAKAPDKIKCLQSSMTAVNEDGQQTDRLTHFYKNLDEFKRMCMEKQPVNTPSVIYRVDLYPIMKREASDAYDLLDHGPLDFDTYCGLADEGVFIYPINSFFGYFYRWHKGQCTWKVHNDSELNKYHNIITEYWRKKWNV